MQHYVIFWFYLPCLGPVTLTLFHLFCVGVSDTGTLTVFFCCFFYNPSLLLPKWSDVCSADTAEHKKRERGVRVNIGCGTSRPGFPGSLSVCGRVEGEVSEKKKKEKLCVGKPGGNHEAISTAGRSEND